MLTLTTLASGSSGNCILVSGGGTHLLIDVGISARRICKSLRDLGVEPENLSGILITHEHSDHVAGLATLTKHYRVPVYASPGTARQLCCRIAALEDVLITCAPGAAFSVGVLSVSTFPTLHDAAQSLGYTVTDGTRKAAVVTDLGVVTDEVLEGVAGANVLVVEANHDVEQLSSGPYPYYLKARILGSRGHLSNEAGGALARRAAEHGAHTVVLAHLSSENNTPARARIAAEAALCGCTCAIEVAPRGEPGRCIEV